MTTARQLSFGRGEVTPGLYARVDTLAYATGARTVRNFRIKRTGTLENRSGWRFVDETRFPAKRSRVIHFIFSVSNGQTYSIELGDQYAEFLQNGARIVEASQSITAISKASPAVVTYVGADPANGDDVVITGGDMPEIVGRRLRIKNVNAGANTYELTHTDNSNLDSTAFTTYTAGAVFARIYKIATPWLEADLFSVQFDQSADVMTLVHPSYDVQELSRLGQTNWTLTVPTFVPAIGRPNDGVKLAVGGAGNNNNRYRITSVDALTGEESSYGYGEAKTITGATQANPVVITCTAHGLLDGDEVYIEGVGGMTELNVRLFVVANKTANTFELLGVDGTGYGAFTFGGSVQPTFVPVYAVADLSATNFNTISWSAIAGAGAYMIYQESNGVYGKIGSVSNSTVAAGSDLTFKNIGRVIDLTLTPPILNNPFVGTGNHPSCVVYAQGRRFFGRTNNNPTRFWGSRTGLYGNFSSHLPIQDDDAITRDLGGSQVNEIRHLKTLASLLIFTAGGELADKGDVNGVVSPRAANIQQYSYNGSSGLAPIIADANVIFVQRDNSIVRDHAFDWQVDGYRGKDLTTNSGHLFDGHTIASTTFQKAPIQTVWCVRDDGQLLSLTYLREEELVGWARHDTLGTFESICCVPEGSQEAVYAVVKRSCSGPGATTRRYIERLDPRYFRDVRDAFFVDSGLTYDGRHTGSITMTLTGGPPWTYHSNLTLTASSAFFAASDVGNSIFLTGADGTLVRCEITVYTSPTVVTVKPNKTVPASMQAVAIATWGKAVYQIGGLWHLEGRQVSVLGDGGVVAGPSGELLTVANGRITLPANQPREVVQVGLPYYSDLKMLDLDTSQGETRAGKKKQLNSLKVYVESTRTVFAGPDLPADDAEDPLENMDEYVAGDSDSDEELQPLTTGVIEIPIKSEWSDGGGAALRNVDPVPVTILAVMPEGTF